MAAKSALEDRIGSAGLYLPLQSDTWHLRFCVSSLTLDGLFQGLQNISLAIKVAEKPDNLLSFLRDVLLGYSGLILF